MARDIAELRTGVCFTDDANTTKGAGRDGVYAPVLGKKELYHLNGMVCAVQEGLWGAIPSKNIICSDSGDMIELLWLTLATSRMGLKRSL